MSVEYCVISIGALSHNRLWGESGDARTSHATTTLVAADGRLILVDPSLPEAILAARFNERTGKTLADVTDVFCTTLRPVHRRGLPALSHAAWWCSETELAHHRRQLEELLESVQRLNADEATVVEADLKLTGRFRPAPETFAPQVSFYPLSGASPGSAGLLLTPAVSTIVVAGDAVLTAAHMELGQVWEGCHDVEQAMESLRDLVELADIVVCGHDNVTFVPRTLM
ncbi:MAG: hypothetical protein BWX88_05078 [Planctomycetes bacterium ADurb.Bin126]|nr:MAG: hypothetical protein BWX88_05078 [Planctomycetes bacterium ADurb.Bin126]HOD84586.1 MBL fold metallo-hydrolase [Phycisphaerae bacterium]HQL76525.1 MBL fold metallo-hydrolase [Phycisphaerae bacterium]